jgi:hypothetical protein
MITDFPTFFFPEDGGRMHLRNVATLPTSTKCKITVNGEP